MQILREWNCRLVLGHSRMTGLLQIIDREKSVFKRVVIYVVFPNVYISSKPTITSENTPLLINWLPPPAKLGILYASFLVEYVYNLWKCQCIVRSLGSSYIQTHPKLHWHFETNGYLFFSKQLLLKKAVFTGKDFQFRLLLM